jgi:hypothetical protein
VEELLAESGVEVDHVTVFRWVQRFTPLVIEAARPCRHVPGDHWFTDETYIKVAGQWRFGEDRCEPMPSVDIHAEFVMAASEILCLLRSNV